MSSSSAEKSDPVMIRVTLSVVMGLSVLLTAGCDDSGRTGVADVLRPGDDPAQIRDRDINKPVVSESGPWPRAVVEEKEFDFGRMRVGTKMKHSFTITNEGPVPLELSAGKATCKCTQFELSSKSVPAGESASLFVEWHGKLKSDAFQHGGKVYTNDPEMPSIRFNVKGIVDAPWVMLPAEKWNTGFIVKNRPIEFEGLVFSGVESEMTVMNISTGDDLTEATYVPMTEEELNENQALCGYRVQVKVTPGPAGGIQRGTVIMEVEELDEDIEIPLETMIYGPVQIKPMRGTRYADRSRRLLLGQFPAANGRKAELLLTVDQEGFNQELKFLEIETSPKALKVALEPMGNATGTMSRYRLKVELPPGGMRLKRMTDNPGFIHCKTNHPTEKEIHLGVEFSSF